MPRMAVSTSAPEPAREERLSILAPSGRDAEVLAAVAASGGFAIETLLDVAALCARVRAGAGALVLTEEALSPADAAALARALQTQPPWSDVPLLLLSTRSRREALRRRLFGVIEPFANLIILERPLRRRTLLAAFESALRARRRQRESCALLEQLDLERRRQDAVLAAMPVGIVVTDTSGHALVTNRAERRIWGGAPPVDIRVADPTYQAWFAGTGRRVEPGGRAIARALATGEEITDEELDIVAVDGARRTLLNSAYPIRDAGGKLAGAVAVHVDVTDRARAERAEQLLSEIGVALSESLEPEVTLGTLARLVAARFAACCVIGATDERGEIHQLIAEFARDIPPEASRRLLGRLSTEAGDAVARQALRSRRSVLMSSAGGAWAPGAPEPDERSAGSDADSLLAVPLLTHGRALGVLAMIRLAPARRYDARDVALADEIGRRAALAFDNGRLHRQAQAALEARAESLAELEAFMAASPVGLAVLDRGLRFVRVNDLLSSLNGLPADQHLGKMLCEVIPPAKADQIAPLIRRALASGEPVLDRALTFDPPAEGGPARHFLLSVIPLLSAGGKTRAAGLVLSEVTRIKEAEEALTRQAAFRERFIGILAHDLRTPMHAIAFSARTLMQQADAPAPWLSTLTRIQRAADRMARMVSDLLDLTRCRHESGIAVTRAPADLEEITRAVLAELEAAHPGREILLSVTGDVRADLDADRMAQVVSNLASNALDYGPPGTAVEVDLTGGDDPLTLAVHNFGAPIPAECLATIFEPFRYGPRAPSADSPTGGLGLGLFIVRAIVQAHGGSVSAVSSAEAGTTFTARLPRARQA